MSGRVSTDKTRLWSNLKMKYVYENGIFIFNIIIIESDGYLSIST